MGYKAFSCYKMNLQPSKFMVQKIGIALVENRTSPKSRK